ncbi:hypothetical protein AB1Y20_017260 [Prymnesium parvum]|uniref:NADP-dependent oxidoreductase domain-containing protein n=1 Tax=Prymnesium parvum TaxID=97485 RepID=A0AB34JLK4_PRYPA
MLSLGLGAAGLSPREPWLRRREAAKLALGAGGTVFLPEARAAPPRPSSAPPRLPALGLGAWAWGDTLFWGYDEKNDAQLAEVFDYAVEQGVRFFDTAEVYGLGRSETLLGKFCAANPAAADVQIATKFAALPWRTKAADVVEAAKRSTARLGRPIDLYQVHFPNAWANERYWDGLAACVDDGLVRAAGVSNYGKEALRACHAKLAERGVKLVSNQVQLSLIYPYPLLNGLCAACDELDVQVLAYSPLGLGLLTGKYELPDKLPDGPRRDLAKAYLADPNFGKLIESLRAVGGAHDGASPAAVSLAWCIAKGACVIPGARTRTQAASNVAAAKLRLSEAEVARLDAAAAALDKSGAQLKPDSAPFPKKDIFTGMTMFDS